MSLLAPALLSLLLPSVALVPVPQRPAPRPALNFPPPPLRRHPLPRCAAGAADDALPRPTPPPRAVDLSRELSKYTSPRVRLVTSAPVRLPLGLIDETRAVARRFAHFYATVLGRVPMHQLLLALMLGAYAAQQCAGEAALYAGARINAYVTAGQWHRLFSPVFLHGSFFHLLSNAYSLFSAGPLAEGAFGKERFLLVYMLAGLGGNLCGLWFGNTRGMSVGASGAVFGIMGSVFAFALRNQKAMGRQADALMNGVGRVLFINILIGCRAGSGIDNLGHVGGFISGAASGLLLAPKLAGAGRGRHLGADAAPGSSFLPPQLARVLLIAGLSAYALGIRDAVKLTLSLIARVGR